MPVSTAIPLPLPAGSVCPGPSPTAPLLAWYDRHRRALPWRALPGGVSDPYAVWLSEVMLQQTTVQAVKPFYARFLSLWPTVRDLAAAPIEDVMRAWAGLGYYSRARNLHACAVAVVRDHGGRFPATEAGLRALPGIGAYTAAAIAAIAFGQTATVVDGNVERVMIRFHAIDQAAAAAKPVVYARMREATPHGRAGDFAQAVMDLGATICTPKNPACAICPLMALCAARRQARQLELPRRKVKKASPVRHGVAFLVRNERGDILVRRRPPTGLLGGMVELPGSAWTPLTEGEPGAAHPEAIGRVTHVFTHFTLLLDVVLAEIEGIAPSARGAVWWMPEDRLDDEALPTLMRRAIDLGLRHARP